VDGGRVGRRPAGVGEHLADDVLQPRLVDGVLRRPSLLDVQGVLPLLPLGKRQAETTGYLRRIKGR
jgi:hypothetical protein